MDDRGFKLISKKEAQEYLKKKPPRSPYIIDMAFLIHMISMKANDKMFEEIKQRYKRG